VLLDKVLGDKDQNVMPAAAAAAAAGIFQSQQPQIQTTPDITSKGFTKLLHISRIILSSFCSFQNLLTFTNLLLASLLQIMLLC